MQGGAIALRATLLSPTTLGGCVALSTYFPGDLNAVKDKQVATPIFQVGRSQDLAEFEAVLWIKYIEFGSGSRILAQFGSRYRVIQSILKEKIPNNFREK